MRNTFIVFFVCFFSILYSQSDSQDILVELNDSIKKYTYTDPKKAIEFSLGVFDNQDYTVPSQSLVNVYYNTSTALQNSNLPAQAIQYLNNAIEIFLSIPASERKNKSVNLPPWILVDIGNIYYLNKNNGKAIEYYNTALKNFKLIENEEEKNYGICTTYDNLALIASSNKNYRKSDSLYRLSYSIREKSNKLEDIMYSRIALLSINLLQDNLKEAFEDLSAIETLYTNYKKTKPSGIQTSNHTRYYGYSFELFSAYYKKQNEIENAIKYKLLALDLLNNFKSEIEVVKLSLAQLYLNNFQNDKAFEILSSSDISENYNLKKYELLAEYYQSKKNLKQILRVKDSIIKYKTGITLRTENNLAKLDTSLMLQQKQIEIQNKDKTNTQIVTILIITIILIASALISLRLNYLLQKKKLQFAEVEKKATQKSLKTQQMELVNKSSFIMQRNKHLNSLLDIVNNSQYKSEETNNLANRVNRVVSNVLKSEMVYDQFQSQFKEVYPDFFRQITTNHGKLTSVDLQLCCYIKLNQTSKMIARITGVSVRTVEGQKYRLKKKLNVPKDQDLKTYILSM
ncbi:MAG: hypothetical protein CBC80_001750 [Flavobacteriaceae bacterium TMED120]|nr:MAG: hypothetical protein CBC80_001750 [Flavobacteriaceae bacterium TMED120]